MDKTSVERTAVELTHEFFDQWSRTCEATYGRLIETSAIGSFCEKRL